ncbi:uncharacterized protein [Procambarus clarkii]|uniref:uncharacterized protein n=1 Tax=Procambarus clarkii TaxID=6728 RepID=UPI0037440F2A
MLHTVVLSCLLALSLASDHGGHGAPQPACQPQQETILVTRTEVNTLHQQVTQYDLQYGHYAHNVTSVILVPSTVIQTQTFTTYPAPDIITQTDYVTGTVYLTKYSTAQATVVATQTTQLLATDIKINESTITQTAIVPQTITETQTIINRETAFGTITDTHTISAFVTKTKIQPFFISETSYVTYAESVIATVTSFSDRTVEATTTFTQHQVVTKCEEPKITYDH